MTAQQQGHYKFDARQGEQLTGRSETENHRNPEGSRGHKLLENGMHSLGAQCGVRQSRAVGSKRVREPGTRTSTTCASVSPTTNKPHKNPPVHIEWNTKGHVAVAALEALELAGLEPIPQLDEINVKRSWASQLLTIPPIQYCSAESVRSSLLLAGSPSD